MKSPVTVDPEIMHGTPCFTGTRVPVQTLFDHLEEDYTVEQFLEQFPSVTRQQVNDLLEDCSQSISQHAMRA